MKWLIGLAIWITFTWNPIPGAHYQIQVSRDWGRTWGTIVFGAIPEARVSIDERVGTVMLKLTVIRQDGSRRTNKIGWFFDPADDPPDRVHLGEMWQ